MVCASNTGGQCGQRGAMERGLVGGEGSGGGAGSLRALQARSGLGFTVKETRRYWTHVTRELVRSDLRIYLEPSCC